MYTWGYLKEVILAKLDLEESEAETQKLIDRFTYFANEAMTQICSSVKPKHTFYTIDVTEDLLDFEFTMPSDFISFDDDVMYITFYDVYGVKYKRETTNDDVRYAGFRKIAFLTAGTYNVPYRAKWITFTNIDDSTGLDIPEDILDSIPSYVASQCFKTDDEYKSSVYRNEFEIAIARLDDIDYKNTKTLHVRGGW